jgi:hypothetical protein
VDADVASAWTWLAQSLDDERLALRIQTWQMNLGGVRMAGAARQISHCEGVLAILHQEHERRLAAKAAHEASAALTHSRPAADTALRQTQERVWEPVAARPSGSSTS